MADTFTKSERLRGLSELLAERHDWPLKNRLAFVRKLARQVRTLHQNGRVHRAIGIDAVGVDEQLRPHLSPPGAPRRFGGEDDCDPEFCPPELTGQDAVELPAEIDAAAAALQKAGYALDPRRVDVYQLGTLLCRLVTGGPILPYIYDATVKARVSAVVRPLLERTLGLESPERWENCERLIEGLDEALRRTELLEAPTSMIETPARGSAIMPDNDTPPQGTQQPPSGIVEPLPFTRLGHYRIVEQIGAGGMGDVYRGYDESLERPVAVKVLPSQLARDADFVRRFHAEATAAAGVAHPNVVPIYFIGEDAGHHFFAMQCIEGESLAERLGRQGQFPVDEALELIGQCLAGLQAAHERGLIHRDIKPGNILLERGSGRAMLVDFGLVRRIGQSAQMTATGVIMGTVDYIAPEQARGREVDARVDIYSLGVLFYQLLSGRMPFTADSPTAMIFQHAYEAPFPLEEAVPGLPPPVARIVERMMAKEPNHRYPDCGAVLADVWACIQGQPLASDESAWAGGFEEESSPGGEPKLPEGLARLLDPGRVQVVRDWAATMFRRHAPEYVQQMQGTTQQVDAAVAHYQRRHNRLAKLLDEARAIESDLSQQIESNLSASSSLSSEAESTDDQQRKQAALAKQSECEEQLTALRSQHELQQQASSDLERQLGKADATLARLCSQQEVMKARLCAAQARQQMEGGLGKSSRRRPAIILAAVLAGGLIVAVGAMMLLPWGPGSPQVDSTPITAPVIAPTKPPLGPAKPAGANLWDFSEGTVVTNWSKTKSDIRNMFGGTFGNSVMLFSDGLPVGTVHFVEWQTPTPITLRSFSLRACHDGQAAGALLRGFSCFRLFAEDPDTGKFNIKLYEISPTNPYGDMPEPPYTHLDRSRGFQHMVLAANIPATTARRFRAEFVQFGPANRAFSGPRIIELEGFDTYYPDQAIPGNHKPVPPVAAPSVASKPAPAAEQPPKPNPKVPPDAALLMTFDKNTLVDASGIIFRIRSLTGRHHGQDVTAQYTPDGKVGGALSIEDGSEVRIPGHIINRQPEFTVTAWIKRKDKEHLWVYNENADGTIFNFEAQTNGAVAVRTWHKGRGPSPSYPGGNWMAVGTPDALVSANQWVFVAARLVNGQVNRGQLTIRVNDRSYARELQMTYHDSTQHSSIGSGNGACEDRTCGRGTGLVDELAVYPRALSDAEIETFYQMGLRGESLGM